MKRFGKRGRDWLKLIHILLATIWLAGGLIIILLFLCVKPVESSGIALKWYSIKLIDSYIIIPGSIGCFVTGVCFSVLTNWGFVGFRWIVAKYLINIEDIVLGAIFLGPWEDILFGLVQSDGINAINDHRFMYYDNLYHSFLIAQVILVIFAFYLSVIKPRLGQKKT